MHGTFINEEGVKPEPKAVTSGSASGLNSFLLEVMAQQQLLQTPVARFSERHDSLATSHTSIYKDLIPLSAPKAGEQYAFEVDLDSCSGCKACVAGCHSLNGLDEEETWRDVGLVVGGEERT
jgi:NAD-dependent dihydropyrimidine dehydrogenase PreA subunit